MRASIWHDYVFNYHTTKQIATKHNRSIKWVRKQLRAYEPPPVSINPRELVVVMDCTFFGRTKGWIVVRDPHRNENVYWTEIERETLDEYQCARDTLESLGFVIRAVIADGKPGLKPLYKDIPVQMCQYHMQAIIIRYITMRPKLEAGIELKRLASILKYSNEESFTEKLAAWHEKWHEFLKEQTVNPETGKWHYTHKRLRSAYRSLKKHLPYLFTYKKYPELNIPNTTNSLDGFFGHLKDMTRIHRGLKLDLKRKIIESRFQNRPTKS